MGAVARGSRSAGSSERTSANAVYPLVRSLGHGRASRGRGAGIKAHHPENDIVLVAPIPVDIDRWRQCRAAKQCLDGEDFDFETYEQCCAYTKRVTSIGFRRGIPVLDLLMLGSDWRKLLVDGVHLHRRGHALMFEALRQLVEQHYTHWQPTRMLGDLPSFDPLRGAPPPVFILPASPDIEDAEVTGGGGRDL